MEKAEMCTWFCENIQNDIYEEDWNENALCCDCKNCDHCKEEVICVLPSNQKIKYSYVRPKTEPEKSQICYVFIEADKSELKQVDKLFVEPTVWSDDLQGKQNISLKNSKCSEILNNESKKPKECSEQKTKQVSINHPTRSPTPSCSKIVEEEEELNRLKELIGLFEEKLTTVIDEPQNVVQLRTRIRKLQKKLSKYRNKKKFILKEISDFDEKFKINDSIWLEKTDCAKNYLTCLLKELIIKKKQLIQKYTLINKMREQEFGSPPEEKKKVEEKKFEEPNQQIANKENIQESPIKSEFLELSEYEERIKRLEQETFEFRKQILEMQTKEDLDRKEE